MDVIIKNVSPFSSDLLSVDEFIRSAYSPNFQATSNNPKKKVKIKPTNKIYFNFDTN